MRMKKFSLFFITILAAFTNCTGQTHKTNELPNWALGGFTRPAGINPIISPKEKTLFYCPMIRKNIAWESNDTFNPAAVLKNGKVIILYRAEDKSGVGIGYRTSRIGYAESTDGVNFTRHSKPVLYPRKDSQQETEWPGGCEDPRVAVTKSGTYVVFYTQWNRKVARIAVATSKDLINWTKHGPIFKKAYNGKFFNEWSKSGAVITKVIDNKQVITKINGKYWMYWGEHGVSAATSDDMINWKPVLDSAGNLKKLIEPRKNYFDSDLTECGPPAIITEKGILLLYNGKNKANEDRDLRFNSNAYSAGQVLFDLKDPTKVIDRLSVPFLRPLEAFEKSGQYAAGTVFIEGLVFFKKKWFLYYGCADSKVAVAVFDPAKAALGDPLPLAPLN